MTLFKTYLNKIGSFSISRRKILRYYKTFLYSLPSSIIEGWCMSEWETYFDICIDHPNGTMCTTNKTTRIWSISKIKEDNAISKSRGFRGGSAKACPTVESVCLAGKYWPSVGQLKNKSRNLNIRFTEIQCISRHLHPTAHEGCWGFNKYSMIEVFLLYCKQRTR